MTLRMPQALHRRLVAQARTNRRSMAAEIVTQLEARTRRQQGDRDRAAATRT